MANRHHPTPNSTIPNRRCDPPPSRSVSAPLQPRKILDRPRPAKRQLDRPTTALRRSHLTPQMSSDEDSDDHASPSSKRNVSHVITPPPKRSPRSETRPTCLPRLSPSQPLHSSPSFLLSSPTPLSPPSTNPAPYTSLPHEPWHQNSCPAWYSRSPTQPTSWVMVASELP